MEYENTISVQSYCHVCPHSILTTYKPASETFNFATYLVTCASIISSYYREITFKINSIDFLLD